MTGASKKDWPFNNMILRSNVVLHISCFTGQTLNVLCRGLYG